MLFEVGAAEKERRAHTTRFASMALHARHPTSSSAPLRSCESALRPALHVRLVKPVVSGRVAMAGRRPVRVAAQVRVFLECGGRFFARALLGRGVAWRARSRHT